MRPVARRNSGTWAQIGEIALVGHRIAGGHPRAPCTIGSTLELPAWQQHLPNEQFSENSLGVETERSS